MFELPSRLIATQPSKTREGARLFVYNRKSRERVHITVREIGTFLRAGDLLVLNDIAVEPARVFLQKITGGRVEVLFLSPTSPRHWEVLLGGKNVSGAKTLRDESGEMKFRITRDLGEGRFELELDLDTHEFLPWLRKHGVPPLPPYILQERRRRRESVEFSDQEFYRTDFFRKKSDHYGAVAAPTAGLHFSRNFLDELFAKGIETSFISLAVGWGTFQPLTEEHQRTGKLHSERVEISPASAQQLWKAKKEGRRIISVGTTVVRSIEWWARLGAPPEGASGDCDLFLRPPWKSEWIDALVTNFHLPDSSLLLLVAGFLGDDGLNTLVSLYHEAISREYRFYSYGDAMLIL